MKKHVIEVQCDLPQLSSHQGRINRLGALQESVEDMIKYWGGDLASITVRSEPHATMVIEPDSKPQASHYATVSDLREDERGRLREALGRSDIQGALKIVQDSQKAQG